MVESSNLKWKYGRIALNLLFWLLILVIPLDTEYSTMNGRSPEGFLVYNFLFFLVIAVVVYVNNLYLMPQFLTKERYGIYIVTLLTLLFTTPFLMLLIRYELGASLMKSEIITVLFDSEVYLPYLLLVSLFVGLFMTAKFSYDWFTHQRKVRKLERQKLKTELAFLRTQVNPHFLFNVLNTVYGLARREKAPETADTVMRLSEMMRYMLYESSGDKISLQKEIKYLTNYVEMERIRKWQNGDIDFKVEGDIQNQTIAPMILINFIENSFKHGMDKQADQAWVRIHLQIEEEELLFTCANSNLNKDSRSLTTASGIGLSNVKRRLNLIYANSYKLDILDEADEYQIQLRLPLENIVPQAPLKISHTHS